MLIETNNNMNMSNLTGGIHMFEDLGGLFGWLLVIAFVGTILNYCLKAVNKSFSKQIAASPSAKKTMRVLMKIFVRNHKYFGIATGVLLLAHFMIQFSNMGPNLTGFIAGIVLILEVGLGIYASVKKKPRKGAWFITHRVLAVLLVLGIAIHIMFPFGFNIQRGQENSYEASETIDTSQLPTFTLDELSEYDGKNGNKAYVAYEGIVYEVTDVPQWKEGEHFGNVAGTDVTEAISKAPHGNSIFEKLEMVGKLE